LCRGLPDEWIPLVAGAAAIAVVEEALAVEASEVAEEALAAAAALEEAAVALVVEEEAAAVALVVEEVAATRTIMAADLTMMTITKSHHIKARAFPPRSADPWAGLTALTEKN
jgi:hypothetical protein